MKQFFILIFLIFLISCHNPFVSCQQKIENQPQWFDSSVLDEGVLNRALSLLPENTKTYIILDIPLITQDKDLEPFLKWLGANLLHMELKSRSSLFNLSSFFGASPQKMVFWVSSQKKQTALNALVIGQFDPQKTEEEIKKILSRDKMELITKRIGEIVVYSLKEDPSWGVILSSNELLLFGNPSSIVMAAKKYQSQTPPSEVKLLFPKPPLEEKIPFFGWGKISNPSSTLKGKNNLSEITARIYKKDQWFVEVRLTCKDEDQAATLKEYLVANQIMGSQISSSISPSLQAFLEAAIYRIGSNVTLEWPLNAIPWESLSLDFKPQKIGYYFFSNRLKSINS